MLKEAFQYIVGLGNKEIKEVGTQKFSTGAFQLIQEATPSPLKVRNLSGIVDYIKNDYDGQPPVMIHIESPTEVKVMSSFNRDMNRNILVQAEALLPTIPFKQFINVEEFNILLQSCFVPNDDRATMLRIVGNIKEEQVRSTGDDGISQAVTTSGGVKIVSEEKVPNPVSLKPFRTFVEVPQPICDFVFRLQDGPRAALIEADGGAWKLQAMANIKDFLLVALEKEVKSDRVVIIA
ncbi:hypothetical protein [Paenibacillus wynnii]|uniref:Phage protein n=1 Tax=Paenibacillus wynnii TaxID=268407 RepID=A0A098M8U6_9BACL|nr:hypothetical protein [Paenibacillus wynnii]KGE18473.1 hypothetical protein PWYN_03125 [Paenibacillus wynnii]KGE20592.1 hypothetical protein PWYN_15495 [Paenibacillus wynnii]